VQLGYSLIATKGTQEFLESRGFTVEPVNKVRQGRPHIVDYLKDGKVDFVINTTEGVKSIADSFSIRRTSLQQKITYCTTMEGTEALVAAMLAIKQGSGLQVRSLQEYLKES
jgi:carbamoyl-phosphate synthase large subunit